MHANGDINIERVADQADYFRRVGAAGVFINGTTAEWASLTVAERKSLTTAWTTHADDTLPIIDHVGHHCQREAIELAGHAASSGVSGISIIAPSYFIMNTAQDIVDWCAPIAAAAVDIPFYYYDLPVLTGVTIPAFDVISLAKDQIPTFAGMKYSGTDPAGLQRCVGLGDYDVFWGSDENLLSGLALGCKAAVGSTYNLALPHYQKLLKAFNSGDTETARQLQSTSLKMVELMLPLGVMPSLKAAQVMTGIELGGTRLPFKSLSAPTVEKLIEGLNTLGIVET
ncbi:dihydrodipicolinate synthase family protein [bacterium AH-315-P07]|nr:dihydrodipicolinate synthase family protein [bacterium AH-315-P07]